MSGVSQVAGNFNLTQFITDDFSFDVSFAGIDGTPVNLSTYDVAAIIIPITTGVLPIPIVIDETDLSTGKLHFFIGKSTIVDMEVLTNQHRWEFYWSYPKAITLPTTTYRRTILSGYFNLEAN